METYFGKLFEENKWAPIQYKDKLVHIADTCDVPFGNISLEIVFEHTNSDWEQGVFLMGNGYFLIDDEKTKGIYLWESTSPKSSRYVFHSKDGKLKVWNIWRIEKNGSMHYGHNGAALYFEEIPGGKRYFCNDGYPDDDFDDLIFTLTIIKDKEPKSLSREK